MDKKEMIIAGVVVVIAVVVGGIVFAPSADAKFTTIDVLNKGDLGQNGTLYVKLTDNEKTSLSDKTLHVKLTGSNGKVVYEESVKTHATGVAIVKVENVSAGEYDLNITFDGDGNYSSSSISQKLTIKGEHIEEQVDNATLIEETIADAQDSSDSVSQPQTSYSQSSYSSSYSSSSSSSSSSSEDTSNTYYDENGNEMLPEYDENGKEVDPI
ncbi:hypothetical protein [uncultured Methanobrevibacter sp.]|uniref:hypothetical protein n=1 Tax=uncultured Methanobrevibacter sp. TaxID=253161 RepID=UPI00262C9842|nr:hypothetical protein [uncultured Methanobrevibacter sp.]